MANSITAQEIRAQMEVYERGLRKIKPYPFIAQPDHVFGDYPRTLDPRDMIRMRLHLPEGAPIPFERFEVHKVHDSEKYLIWIVNSGQSVVIEDEGKLFPSDTLITQLQLLIG